jgi:protein-tyrosine phosphatase
MVLDFHSHILPGVDHGSDSLETSLKQLRFAEKNGISRIVATSHFYPHSRGSKSFFERREEAYSRLCEAKSDIKVELALGAEVLVCSSIERLPDIDKLCIAGTRTLLLELPFADFQSEYCRSVYNLIDSGFEVVMAHAERYDPSWIEETLEAGAKLQLNAKALSIFNRKHYTRWLEQGDVVALGSDIHGADSRAYKQFRAASRVAERYSQMLDFSSRLWNTAIKK